MNLHPDIVGSPHLARFDSARMSATALRRAFGFRPFVEIEPRITVRAPVKRRPPIIKSQKLRDRRRAGRKYSAQHKRMDVIRHAVASAAGFHPGRLLTPDRARKVSWPRMVAFLLIRERVRASTPVVGKMFDRDHTTIFHGLEKAEWLVRHNPKIRDIYNRAIELLDGEAARP